MTEKKASMKFGEKEYRFVPDRIKQFREENPRGDIDTNPTFHEDGSLTFKAIATRDVTQPSARGSGTAHYSAEEMKPKKAFEKLETISVGRALSMLGYLNDGQVASTEEMEEFNDYKADLLAEAIQAAIQSFNDAKTIDELKKAFIASELMFEDEVIAAKDKRKSELSEPVIKLPKDGKLKLSKTTYKEKSNENK